VSSGDDFCAALVRLQQECPQVTGAVLATADGLILAATGNLASDAAAASAVHLTEEVDRCLALLSDRRCDHLLVWGESAIWCLIRLSGRCALLARAGADCQAGALRLAVEGIAQELAPALAGLDSP
jgi:predicted regulator of Ras-like GTPase activity (Roadblock/LC7/MglB family)